MPERSRSRAPIRAALVGAMTSTLLLASPAAQASDGCTVLLCLAGNWSDISECIAPVHRALRRLSLGLSLPHCEFGSSPLPALPGSGSSDSEASSSPATSHANSRWAIDDFCPPQYRVVLDEERGESQWQCRYTGAIEVVINGQLWNRTWWDLSGNTVTEWTPLARSVAPQLATDDRFDREYAAWRSSRPLPADPEQRADGG